MAKDKKINEIPGIAGAAVVQLTRIGVVTLADLLQADFDRVAYVLEDFKEATRLVNEAQRLLKGKDSRRAKASEGHHADHVVPVRPQFTDPPRDEPRPADEPAVIGRAGPRDHPALPGHPAPINVESDHPDTTTAAAGDGPLSIALGLAARGVSIADTSDPEPRLALARRLAATDLLLRYNAKEHELIAALLTEVVELGSVTPQETLARFGPDIWRTLEQAMALRAVPLMPTGKPPRYYLEMAAAAHPAARRVCAAYLAQSLAAGTPGSANLFHARLLLDALRAGGPDDLVDLAAAAIDHAAADQAARIAA